MKKLSKVIFDAATLLIQNEWIKNDLCQDKDGTRVSLHSPKAVKFDLTGSLLKSCNMHYGLLAEVTELISDIENGIIYNDLSTFNDAPKTTKKKVVNLLNSAYTYALQLEGAKNLEQSL